MEKPTKTPIDNSQEIIDLNPEEDPDIEYISLSTENKTPTNITRSFNAIMPIEKASQLPNFQIVSAVSLADSNSNSQTSSDNWPKIQQVFSRSSDSNSAFQFELINSNDASKVDAAALFLQSDSNLYMAPQHSEASQSSSNSNTRTDDQFRVITEASDQSEIDEEELQAGGASLSARNTPQLRVTDDEDTSVKQEISHKRLYKALITEQDDKRDSRRKSQHVVRANCESPTFEFREEPIHKMPVNANPNELLMKKLAFLRTATNFLLKETGRKTFQFKQNIDSLSFVDVFREIEQNK